MRPAHDGVPLPNLPVGLGCAITPMVGVVSCHLDVGNEGIKPSLDY